MSMDKAELRKIDPGEVFEWDTNKLDGALKELEIKGGSTWNKAKKAHELYKALKEMAPGNSALSPIQSQDNPNIMMVQALQQMQQQQQQFMAQIAGRFGGEPGSNNGGGRNKSRAKCRHPEKVERDVDDASFLPWEKSWYPYVISDNLETLTKQQQTAVFFSFFTKELSSDLEYRFKININAEQKVKEIIETMKTYLKGQRSMVLARYNLFTRRQHYGETFEDWYCELRRLYDLAEAEDIEHRRKNWKLINCQEDRTMLYQRIYSMLGGTFIWSMRTGYQDIRCYQCGQKIQRRVRLSSNSSSIFRYLASHLNLNPMERHNSTARRCGHLWRNIVFNMDNHLHTTLKATGMLNETLALSNN